MSDLEQIPLDSETLERVEVLYEVKATFVIQAGVYAGINDTSNLAELINDRRVQPEDIDSFNIREVTVDDVVVARA